MQKNKVIYRIFVDGEPIMITLEMVEATEPEVMQEYLRMLWRQEHRERREYRCRDVYGVRCMGSCSECRQNCSGKPVSLEVLAEAGMVFADHHSVEETVNRRLLIEALCVAVESLEPIERKVIELLFFRGCTQREAAERLGMSQSSVNRHKKRALNTLRELLADYR